MATTACSKRAGCGHPLSYTSDRNRHNERGGDYLDGSLDPDELG